MAQKAKRISDITKEFDLKSKDVIALFKDLGIEKNNGSTLDDTEYQLFLQVLTQQNQIENLDDYLDGKATLHSDRPKAAEKKESAAEKKAEKTAPKADAPKKAEEKSKDDSAMNDILSRVSISSTVKKSEITPDKKAPARPAPSQPAAAAVQKPAPAQTPSATVSSPKPAAPATPAAPAKAASAAPAANRGPQNQSRPAAPARKGAINQAELQKKMEAFRVAQEQRLAEEEKARRAARSAAKANAPKTAPTAPAAPAKATPAAPTAPAAPAVTPALARKEAEKAKGQEARKETAAALQKEVKVLQKKDPVDRFSRFERSALTQKPQPKKEEKAPRPDKRGKSLLTDAMPAPTGTVEVVETKAPKTRVVDTRTSTVDLSKYDERLENFTNPASDYSPQRQKLKKQDNRSQGKSAKDKARMAREKMKRIEAEMARKKQLEITVPDEIVVSELASRMKKTSGEVIKQLMKLGVMASINETVDYDTAYLVAEEMGIKVTKEVVVTIEEKLFDEAADPEDALVERSPVVCVMGHVDHGKTSLLDAIRHTNVTRGEAGGITQAIGAYRVNINGHNITFLDTPGHEAFTAMRARGAQATDIAILVVAADDGIMPQTVEAINHAKAAGIDIIVAINKMDKPHANPDQVKQELTKYDLLPEEWGGDTICVPVSALTGMGIENLLESVLLVAEVKELKANPNRRAKGLIIESRLDKSRGPVATVLVQNGTLHQGDIVIAGTAVGRVRAMMDDTGKQVSDAGPSVPVEILGLSEVPQAGDEFNAVEDEKMARSLAEQRREKAKQEAFGSAAKVSLDDLFARISEGEKTLSVIVKADVDGSAEAVKSSLEKIAQDDVRVRVIHSAVGGITENDVMLAAASNAIIVGFNVRPDKNALDTAERQGVDIRTYRVIYECIEEITAAMKGLLAPEYKEVLLGHAEVRQTIHVPNVGTIAGSYVLDGKVTRKAQIRVVRDGVVVFEDKISSLRRFKDDVREVASGYECGIGLERFNDLKEGDILEAFEMQEVPR